MNINELSTLLKNNLLLTSLVAFFILTLIGINVCIYAKSSDEYINPHEGITIIIDAGHGGIDPGKVSDSGLNEKDINLSIAMKLKNKLEAEGYNVIITRDSDNSLADASADNQKRSDMNNRLNIINNSNAACMICIHQNSYPDSAIHGAQVFYHDTSAEGKQLAEIVQRHLKEDIEPENKRQAKPGDSYYILKKSTCTSIIVECGFLSNPAEAEKLNTNEYQNQLVLSICDGVNEYFDATLLLPSSSHALHALPLK